MNLLGCEKDAPYSFYTILGGHYGYGNQFYASTGIGEHISTHYVFWDGVQNVPKVLEWMKGNSQQVNETGVKYSLPPSFDERRVLLYHLYSKTMEDPTTMAEVQMIMDTAICQSLVTT